MKADYAGVRHHLEQARLLVPPGSEAESEILQALDLLIEAVLHVEHSRTPRDGGGSHKVISFPSRWMTKRRR